MKAWKEVNERMGREDREIFANLLAAKTETVVFVVLAVSITWVLLA